MGRHSKKASCVAVDSKTPPIQRLVVQPKALPQPAYLERELASTYSCVLTDNGTGLTVQLTRALQAKGWNVIVLRFPETVVKPTAVMPQDLDQEMLQDMEEASLQTALHHIAQTHGAIGAVIHLMPQHATPLSAQAILKHVFLMAKYVKASLNKAGEQGYGCFVTVTRLDGALGTCPRSPMSTTDLPISGGLFGLTKSLNLEWPHVLCRTVDVSPDLDISTSVEAILAELHDPNRCITEVGYGTQGTQGRVTLVAQPQPEAPTNQSIQLSSSLNLNSVV
ncbi:MAG: hypothetical protein AAGD25_39590, partial [Cyanobacteria bacterium P01_F01_bin.150]